MTWHQPIEPLALPSQLVQPICVSAQLAPPMDDVHSASQMQAGACFFLWEAAAVPDTDQHRRTLECGRRAAQTARSGSGVGAGSG